MEATSFCKHPKTWNHCWCNTSCTNTGKQHSCAAVQFAFRVKTTQNFKKKKAQLVGLKSKWECQRSSSSSLLFPHDTKQGAHSSMSRSLGWGRNRRREGEENTWRTGQGCSLHDSFLPESPLQFCRNHVLHIDSLSSVTHHRGIARNTQSSLNHWPLNPQTSDQHQIPWVIMTLKGEIMKN